MRTLSASLFCLFFASVSQAQQIALVRTFIKEGNFHVSLYESQRSELPLEDRDGIKITTYSYQSYFHALDTSYVAGYTDWSPSKNFERRKWGEPLSSVESDLETSAQGLRHTVEQGLGVPVKLITSKRITLRGFPGREADYEFVSGPHKYAMRYRTYMVGDREYWLQVVFPEAYRRVVRSEDFLNSLELPNMVRADERGR